MRHLVFTLLALVACAPRPAVRSSPTAEPATARSSTSNATGGATHATGNQRRGVYVGAELLGRYSGQLSSAATSEVALPADLERLGTTIFAEGHVLYTARDGNDLVILLADSSDVVTDDMRLPGKGRHRLISACHDDAFLGIAEPGACEGTDSATPTDTVVIDAGALVRGRHGLVCFCDIE